MTKPKPSKPAPLRSRRARELAAAGDSYKRRHDEWKAKNPLRIARHDRGLSMQQAATMLGGKAVMTLSFWEGGGNRPEDENMALIAKAFEWKSKEALVRAWDAWESDRPKLRG